MHPEYVKNAKFIREEAEVDESLWPRSLSEYRKTKKWNNRTYELIGIITEPHIKSTLKTGDVYSSISNTVSFVKEFDGVVVYVVVSAELNKIDTEYPTEPEKHNFTFKAVTLWPYVYDEDVALDAYTWNMQELDKIRRVCDTNSTQPELAKRDIKGPY